MKKTDYYKFWLLETIRIFIIEHVFGSFGKKDWSIFIGLWAWSQKQPHGRVGQRELKEKKQGIIGGEDVDREKREQV